MAHEEHDEEQNDPVAQSTSKSPTTSTADLSESNNKEILVVKEEETNDTEVFDEEVVLNHVDSAWVCSPASGHRLGHRACQH